MASNIENPTYLGDGVYARYDELGRIWLAVDHHKNEVVCLEPQVINALNKFYKYAEANKQEK